MTLEHKVALDPSEHKLDEYPPNSWGGTKGYLFASTMEAWGEDALPELAF